MVKVSKSPRGRARLSIVWTFSIIASVWTTLLIVSLIGDQLFMMLVLAYAVTITGIAVLFLIRPGKIKSPVAQQDKVPESPPQQLA